MCISYSSALHLSFECITVRWCTLHVFGLIFYMNSVQYKCAQAYKRCDDEKTSMCLCCCINLHMKPYHLYCACSLLEMTSISVTTSSGTASLCFFLNNCRSIFARHFLPNVSRSYLHHLQASCLLWSWSWQILNWVKANTIAIVCFHCNVTERGHDPPCRQPNPYRARTKIQRQTFSTFYVQFEIWLGHGRANSVI